MKNISKFILGSLVMGACVLTGCKDAEYDDLHNQAFILQTKTDANSSQKLTVGNETVTTSINVRLSDPAVELCSYRLIADAEALANFNNRNQTTYEVLPAGAYTLSANEVTIEEGQSVSSPVTLTVNPFSQEMKASGKKYAIAFRLESSDHKSEVLKSGSVMVYVLDQVIIQPVVQLSRYQYITNELPTKYDLTEWTLEMNVNMSVLGTAVGQLNNQAIFSASPNEIYIRFGDAPIEGNRLQIKTQGTQMNSQLLFSTNTWYHIAFVCTSSKLSLYVNGQLDNSMDVPGQTTEFKAYNISSNSTYTRGDEMFSEVRFWNRARTQAEIQNNMYVCDPTTEGLIFYHKLDEGAGSTFKDVSANKFDAGIAGSGEPTWIPDVRIDGK